MSHDAGNSSSTLQLKLQGRKNYSTWKVAMKTDLQKEGLWDCIEAPPGGSISTDEEDLRHARDKIIRSLNSLPYSNVKDAKTAAEVWKELKRAFEDTELTRCVGLLRTLITTQFINCASVNDYIDTVITTAHSLDEIGIKIGDELIGMLLLAGLPKEYKFTKLENSGTPITGDAIKTKLLQDNKLLKLKENKDPERLSSKWAKPQGSGCDSSLRASDSAESRDNAANESSSRVSNLDRNGVNAGHGSRISTSNSTSNNDWASSSINDTVLCLCDQPARKYKVKKDSPNKGRTFYKCTNNQTNPTCNFYKWADKNDVDNCGNTDWNNRSKVPQKGSAPKKPRLAGSKRKCSKCGMEGHTRTRCPE